MLLPQDLRLMFGQQKCLECQRHSLGICANCRTVKKRWPVVSGLHIIFSCPYHFYRLARSFCNMCSFTYKVCIRISSSSKAATQKHRVYLNLFLFQSQYFCRCSLFHSRPLCARPYITFIAFHFYSAVKRLHGSMSQVRKGIFYFNYFGSLFHSSRYITCFNNRFSICVCQ